MNREEAFHLHIITGKQNYLRHESSHDADCDRRLGQAVQAGQNTQEGEMCPEILWIDYYYYYYYYCPAPALKSKV